MQKYFVEARQLLALAIPVILAQVAQTAMGFVDTVMAGGYSATDMAAVAIGNSIWLPAILTSAITGPLATCLFRLEMNDPASAVASGMGTCGMVGPIGVYAGWVNDVATGAKAAITSLDWVGLALICFVLPAVLCWLFGLFFRRIGWIKEGDLTLE